MHDRDGDVSDVWEAYKSTGDRELRNKLVLRYSPLVKYVAGRIRPGLPQSVDMADLLSDGVLGLMDAIEKFDPERGLQFQTYAVPRIRGAILDGLRATDWVPRTVRNKIREIERAQATLEHQLGRTPDDQEIAAELGISIAELRQLYSKVAYTGVAYLDEVGMSGTATAVGDTVTVTVSSEATLQMLRLVGGDVVSFEATASVEAVKVEP